jgi:hypothetical protein
MTEIPIRAQIDVLIASYSLHEVIGAIKDYAEENGLTKVADKLAPVKKLVEPPKERGEDV